MGDRAKLIFCLASKSRRMLARETSSNLYPPGGPCFNAGPLRKKQSLAGASSFKPHGNWYYNDATHQGFYSIH